jgi:aminoglycoside/choline kinase family phosphotransferase
MVEQIEKNIPAHEEQYLRISEHLIKFWTPQMRTDLFQEVKDNRQNYSEVVGQVVDDMRAKAKA